MEPTRPEQVPSTETVRDAIWRRVRSTSLRAMARRLGVTPTGLQGFLDGASPYHKTLHKYLEWYFAGADDPTDRVRQVALDVLTIGVPAEDRPAVREGLLDYLRSYKAEARPGS
ncbi:MAG TPA: hypothetical protein VHG91_19150 [Longimicrobium sp.]|nr:hypothetical protein [Longimicrobium sp.]